MCTALISVRPGDPWPVLLFSTRDESQHREWDPPGRWWPCEYPNVVGGRDRQAGGSWFAVNQARGVAATVLNRIESLGDQARKWSGGSRGDLVLRAASVGAGPSAAEMRGMAPFNLLLAGTTHVTWYRWDGRDMEETSIGAGTHLLATRDLDDPADTRVVRWLPRLRASVRPDPVPNSACDRVWQPWTTLLEESVQTISPDNDSALMISKTVGRKTVATLSLSAAAFGLPGVRFDFAEVKEGASVTAWRRICG